MPFTEAGAVKYVVPGRNIVHKEVKLQSEQRSYSPIAHALT